MEENRASLWTGISSSSLDSSSTSSSSLTVEGGPLCCTPPAARRQGRIGGERDGRFFFLIVAAEELDRVVGAAELVALVEGGISAPVDALDCGTLSEGWDTCVSLRTLSEGSDTCVSLGPGHVLRTLFRFGQTELY